LSNQTRTVYLHCLRRLLDDLAANGHPLPPDLIRRQAFPPLPRPICPNRCLQKTINCYSRNCRTDDLPAHALLLTRATGIRIGECISLPLDGLRQLGSDQWALHVPLGKLHSERWSPPMPKCGASWPASRRCALWLRPRIGPNPKAYGCLASVGPSLAKLAS